MWKGSSNSAAPLSSMQHFSVLALCVTFTFSTRERFQPPQKNKINWSFSTFSAPKGGQTKLSASWWTDWDHLSAKEPGTPLGSWIKTKAESEMEEKVNIGQCTAVCEHNNGRCLQLVPKAPKTLIGAAFQKMNVEIQSSRNLTCISKNSRSSISHNATNRPCLPHKCPNLSHPTSSVCNTVSWDI